MSRIIVLDVSLGYPLKNIVPGTIYRIAVDIEDGRKKHVSIFMWDGNIYYQSSVYGKIDKIEHYWCSIEKMKRFITQENIKYFFQNHEKRKRQKTIKELYEMLISCEYKWKISFCEYYEVKNNLQSDFSDWYKFDDLYFVSEALSPSNHPGDASISDGSWRESSVITLDMIADQRKNPVPECIKEKISYFANCMLREKLVDIKYVQFLLHAKIEFTVIGSLHKDYKIYIIMVDDCWNHICEKRFCLCDCKKEMEDAVEGYFRSELFPEKAVL